MTCQVRMVVSLASMVGRYSIVEPLPASAVCIYRSHFWPKETSLQRWRCEHRCSLRPELTPLYRYHYRYWQLLGWLQTDRPKDHLWLCWSWWIQLQCSHQASVRFRSTASVYIWTRSSEPAAWVPPSSTYHSQTHLGASLSFASCSTGRRCLGRLWLLWRLILFCLCPLRCCLRTRFPRLLCH